MHAVPGEGADVEVWILGSSGGESAEVAGCRGLPFAANYHVSPATVLDAVEGYRASSARRRRGRASTSRVGRRGRRRHGSRARELASGYGLWVRSIRTGAGAIAFPTPDEARRHEWTDEDRALVQDRLDTQFVGSPAMVADQLELLAGETERRRAAHHDHHPRPRRSGPLLRAARRRVGGAAGRCAREGSVGERARRANRPSGRERDAVTSRCTSPSRSTAPAGTRPRGATRRRARPSCSPRAYWVDLVRTAERGLLDFVTIEDAFGLQSSRFARPDDRTDQVRGRLDAVLIASLVAPSHDAHRAGADGRHDAHRAVPHRLGDRHARLT